MITLKCVKNQCGKYFETDGFERCQLVDQYIKDECIGFHCIRDKQEKIQCQISKLQQEYSYLLELPLIIWEGQ